MVSGRALRTCECSQARPIRFFNRLSWPGPFTPPFNEEHVGKLWSSKSSMIIWLSHGIWGVPHFRTNPFETLFTDACKSSPGTIPRSCLDCPCPRSGSLKQSWFGARTGQRNPGQGAYVFVVVTLTCKRHYVLFPLKTVSAQIATKNSNISHQKSEAPIPQSRKRSKSNLAFLEAGSPSRRSGFVPKWGIPVYQAIPRYTHA